MILLRFFRSSIGLKWIMGLTGIGLFGFVVMHMLGNLQIFGGSNMLNGYADFLQSTPELLWSARAGLLAITILHIYAAITLTLQIEPRVRSLMSTEEGRGHSGFAYDDG